MLSGIWKQYRSNQNFSDTIHHNKKNTLIPLLEVNEQSLLLLSNVRNLDVFLDVKLKTKQENTGVVTVFF